MEVYHHICVKNKIKNIQSMNGFCKIPAVDAAVDGVVEAPPAASVLRAGVVVEAAAALASSSAFAAAALACVSLGL